MRIISVGLCIGFLKIWLKELLGLTGFGLRCSDFYVVNICCDLFVFWGSGMSAV